MLQKKIRKTNSIRNFLILKKSYLIIKIISKAKPKLSILMHFRKGNRGYGVIADINDVKKAFPSLKELDETSVCFDENEVPEEIITLEPVQ